MSVIVNNPAQSHKLPKKNDHENPGIRAGIPPTKKPGTGPGFFSSGTSGGLFHEFLDLDGTSIWRAGSVSSSFRTSPG
tara:strand:- start:841 stop:1074 length:234 start_codon:yes stop_codon:yes gene_type:complete